MEPTGSRSGKSGRPNTPGWDVGLKSPFLFSEKSIEAVGELIYLDGLNRARGQYEMDTGQYEKMEEIFFPPGCGGMFRKAVFDEIGLFDEDFFAYGDDAEIGIRASAGGLELLYVPKAVLYHKNSVSRVNIRRLISLLRRAKSFLDYH